MRDLASVQDQCVEAQQQKQLQAEQSAVVFSQHHHIHLVRVRPLRQKLQNRTRIQ